MANPYKKLDILQEAFRAHADDNDLDETITKRQHYKEMFNLINLIRNELKTAEYQFQTETIDEEVIDVPNTTQIMTRKELSDDLVIIQPVVDDTDEMFRFDIDSMQSAVSKAVASGILDANVLIFPPFVNILRAKLVEDYEEDINPVPDEPESEESV